jgi:hypothetical protein
MREIAASKVCSSHTETSHQQVEERASEVSNFLGAVKDVSCTIKKRGKASAISFFAAESRSFSNLAERARLPHEPKT